MTSSEPAPLEASKGVASRARIATGLVLVPYFLGALGMWVGFPLTWNLFGVKVALILALPFIGLTKFPLASSAAEDRWQWLHFSGTVAYLILASWLMFRNPVLFGCLYGLCF